MAITSIIDRVVVVHRGLMNYLIILFPPTPRIAATPLDGVVLLTDHLGYLDRS